MKSGYWQLAAAFLVLSCLTGVAWSQSHPDHRHDEDHAHVMDADEEFLRHAHEDDHSAPHRQSMLMWYLNALGWRYGLGLPLLGLIAFVLSLLLVIRGGQYAGPALIFVVSMPFLFGVLGVVDGMIMTLTTLSHTETAPRPSEVAEGISLSLVAANFGLFMMAPSFLVATAGLFIRTMVGDRDRGKT